MDEPDAGRDDEGNELKEVVGHGISGIRCEEALVLGANGDDGTDENNGFNASVISLFASIYNICPVEEVEGMRATSEHLEVQGTKRKT